MKNITLLSIAVCTILIPTVFLQPLTKYIYMGESEPVFIGTEIVIAEIRYGDLELDWDVPLKYLSSMDANDPLQRWQMDDKTASILFYLYRFWNALSDHDKSVFHIFVDENLASERHRELTTILFDRLKMCTDDVHLNWSLHYLMPSDRMFSLDLLQRICKNDR